MLEHFLKKKKKRRKRKEEKEADNKTRELGNIPTITKKINAPNRNWKISPSIVYQQRTRRAILSLYSILALCTAKLTAIINVHETVAVKLPYIQAIWLIYRYLPVWNASVQPIDCPQEPPSN